MSECTNTTTPRQPSETDSPASTDAASDTWLRIPTKADGAAVHRLISECPPLDLNSVYTYLLLTEHFSETCVLAGSQEELQGFVSGYTPPDRPDVLFVWQVAVHERARGKGLGRQMLHHLLQRKNLAHIQYIETTVGPENLASRGMFAAVARSLNAPVSERPLFERHLFGPQGHDDEPLIRIGPIPGSGLP